MSMVQDDPMFGDPKGAFETVEPGKYIVKLIRLERLDDGDFGPRRKWVFNVADPVTRTPIYDAKTGEKHEFPVVTSTKLGPKAKARMLAEGLLGRDLTPDDSGGAIADEVMDRKGDALIGPNENGYVTILSLKPYVEKAAVAAAPAKAAAPAAEGEEL